MDGQIHNICPSRLVNPPLKISIRSGTIYASRNISDKKIM